MPGANNIRWRSKDRQLLDKTVERFNNKLKRITKKNPNAASYLPNSLSYSELKSKIKTRQDFNREINRVQRFLRRGAEQKVENVYGVETTKWQRYETALDVGIINRRRASQRKKTKEQAVMSGTYMSIKRQNLEPKQFNFEKIKKDEWNRFVANAERMSMKSYDDEKLEQFKRNYIQGIYEEDGLGTSLYAEQIARIVQSIPARILFDAVQSDPRLEISFMYSPEEIEDKAELMLELLTQLRDSVD